MKIHDSALKHGVLPGDPVQAADWPLWVEPLDEEAVVLMFESGDEMVIHAMQARKQYWEMLP